MRWNLHDQLGAEVVAANVHDAKLLETTLNAIVVERPDLCCKMGQTGREKALRRIFSGKILSAFDGCLRKSYEALLRMP